MLLLQLIVLLTQFFATALVVGFTVPSSILRVGILPVVATCTWISVSTSQQCRERGPWAAIFGGYSVLYLLQYLSLALFKGRTFETQDQSKTFSRRAHDADISDVNVQSMAADTYLLRLKYGLAAASTFRSDDTKNLPAFSAKQPDWVPSRPAFLRRTFIKLVACYIVLDIVGLGADAEVNVKSFSPQQTLFFRRLSEISEEEIATRVLTTLGTGITIYCFQDGLQSLFALTAVSMGISDVESWRPRFGSLRDAYTIRRFWRYVQSCTCKAVRLC